jgi:hypothetical protein
VKEEVGVMGKRKRRDELIGMLIDYLNRIEFYDGCWGKWGEGLLVCDEEEWEEREWEEEEGVSELRVER